MQPGRSPHCAPAFPKRRLDSIPPSPSESQPRKRSTPIEPYGASEMMLPPSQPRASDHPRVVYVPQVYDSVRMSREAPVWKEAKPKPSPSPSPTPGQAPIAASYAIPTATPMDIASLQAQAEYLERQRRLETEEAEKEAELQCRQMFDSKGVRVTHACEHCRQRKAKCTGTQPCTRCTKQGRLCTFSKIEKKRKVSTTPRQLSQVPNVFAPAMVSWVDGGAGTAFPSFHPSGTVPTTVARAGLTRYAGPLAAPPMVPRAATMHPAEPSVVSFGHPGQSVMDYSGSMLVSSAQLERIYPSSHLAAAAAANGSVSVPSMAPPTLVTSAGNALPGLSVEPGGYVYVNGATHPHPQPQQVHGHGHSSHRHQSAPLVGHIKQVDLLPNYESRPETSAGGPDASAFALQAGDYVVRPSYESQRADGPNGIVTRSSVAPNEAVAASFPLVDTGFSQAETAACSSTGATPGSSPNEAWLLRRKSVEEPSALVSPSPMTGGPAAATVH